MCLYKHVKNRLRGYNQEVSPNPIWTMVTPTMVFKVATQLKVIDPAKGMIKLPYLVLSFPCSNAQLCRVLPSQNTECFLYGPKSLFEEIGGVPQEIWFDNLTAAVKKVLQGPDRELTAAFEEFRWYYRFEAQFCSPARGYVENKVGYVRRNFLSPMPVITDLEEFNKELSEKLVKDRQRRHYYKGETIARLWEEDKRVLLALPTVSFEPSRAVTAVVNRVNEITIDGDTYHVPKASPREQVFVKVYWDTIEVFDKHGEEKLGQFPRSYVFDAGKIDWKAELEVFRNKVRALERGAYLKALPEVVKKFLLVRGLKEPRSRLQALLELFEYYVIPVHCDRSCRDGLKGRQKRFGKSPCTCILHDKQLQASAFGGSIHPIGTFRLGAGPCLLFRALYGGEQPVTDRLREYCKKLKLGNLVDLYDQVEYQDRKQYLVPR